MPIRRVCAACFDDADLRSWIRSIDGSRGCDACGRFDSPTSELSELCEYIQACLKTYWGFAVEQLPYESAEGGYQGITWDTAEILYDEVELCLPRDTHDRLYYALLNELTDEVWCEYDWLTLDFDVALSTSWERFCETIKHRRRFFFHADGRDDRDSYTAASLLESIANISARSGLIKNIPVGTRLWRARTDIAKRQRASANDFGPPPPHLALQSNRMNPPGIPMLYLASTAKTALFETKLKKRVLANGKLQDLLKYWI